MQTIRFDFNPMMAEYVGEHGIARADMEDMLSDAVDNNAYNPDGVKFATMVVAVTPILFVYPFLQKYFVKGIMIGSIKG